MTARHQQLQAGATPGGQRAHNQISGVNFGVYGDQLAVVLSANQLAEGGWLGGGQNSVVKQSDVTCYDQWTKALLCISLD
jgi:hypothetical protein